MYGLLDPQQNRCRSLESDLHGNLFYLMYKVTLMFISGSISKPCEAQ